jgi:hypothetical protein
MRGASSTNAFADIDAGVAISAVSEAIRVIRNLVFDPTL